MRTISKHWASIIVGGAALYTLGVVAPALLTALISTAVLVGGALFVHWTATDPRF